MSRPSDYLDAGNLHGESESANGAAGASGVAGAGGAGGAGRSAGPAAAPVGPKLDAIGWLRWAWRQLTSMRTALVLLLMLALAAIPGSLVPQRSADPNGVIQYFNDDPALARVLDALQLFDVFGSVWFSAIYLLLFISLIGCVLPRAKHHWQALRAEPPVTPSRLSRLPSYVSVSVPLESGATGAGAGAGAATAVTATDEAERLLRRNRYRVRRLERGGVHSVSAERGYLRETGNLLFHVAMLGVLASIWVGSVFSYTGQRVLVTGETFVNTLSSYDSFTAGRLFNPENLPPYAITLERFTVTYEEQQLNALGKIIDYSAEVSTRSSAGAGAAEIKVNVPMHLEDSFVYLLGNGYAPTITVRNPEGAAVFEGPVPFLPQDTEYTSNGVIKVPDGLAEQLGMIGFFYPTQAELTTGAYVSIYPDVINPVLTLNVYSGDLQLDSGLPRSVYVLDTDAMTPIAGSTAAIDALVLRPGETVNLPDGLGTVTFETVERFVSFDIHHDPAQVWVLIFAILAIAGLFTGLFIPRRRVWITASARDGQLVLEYAGLGRGEDPGLNVAVADLSREHQSKVGLHS